jgi:calcyphosin
VTPEEAHFLFGIFDVNQDGSISYDEFLRTVVGTMSSDRLLLVKRAFQKLDVNSNGQVDLEDIKSIYNAKQHPDVKLGKKTEEEVFIEFMDTFELHYSLLHPGITRGDKVVSLDEFIEYYNNISMSFEDDRYFELMMINAWNLNNTPVQRKGWGGQY